jgi:lipoprotein NlpD
MPMLRDRAAGELGRRHGRRWVWRLQSALLASILMLGGCASSGPAPVEGFGSGSAPRGYYRVRAGDTLAGIAARKRVSAANLIRWNRLKPPYHVYEGTLLRVRSPDRVSPRSPASVSRTTPAKAVVPESVSDKSREPPGAGAGDAGTRSVASRIAWAWPVDGAVVQGFRAGDRTRQGLRITCRPGTEVKVAASGTVAYSGSGLKGYGNLIIVQHNKTYLSAYGFNRRLFVREGDSVKRGQAIAECGQGPKGAFLLHFEVRREGASVNPILYLPQRH